MKRVGLVISLLWIVLPAAAATPGSISGVVRSANGTPQMGAVIELAAAGSIHPAILYSDAQGRFSLRNVLPGTYQVKASAATFLPTLRENVLIKSGANAVVNLTLNTLFEAVQLLPARKTSPMEDDDWKWTLRSTMNRPILRVLDDSPVVVSSSERPDDKTLRATVAFVAGADGEGFGSAPDYGTSFAVDQDLFAADTLAFRGRVGYGNGSPVGVIRAAYSHKFASGANPQLAVTVRRLVPAGSQQLNALSSLSWSYSDHTVVADFLELNYGTEMQTVQFVRHLNGLRPFGSAAMHISPNSKLVYGFATAEPVDRFARLFDGDQVQPGPRLSIAGNSTPELERASHQELAYQRRRGSLNIEIAGFFDQISNAALTGAGVVSSAEESQFIPDFTSDSFTYNGGRLHTDGVRAVAERKMGNYTATVGYSYGGVLAASPGENATWQEVRSSIHTERAHAVTTKLSGIIPVTGTRWAAAYKWTSNDALSPVDLFNTSASQSDPFLNLRIRQRIPGSGLIPAKVEAVVDVRNLLAQGYRPFVGSDGRTLYLVQATRAVRGGLAFTF